MQMTNYAKLLRVLLSAVILATTFSVLSISSPRISLAADGETLVATTAISDPVGGNGALFWIDNRYSGPLNEESMFRSGSSIYGYNIRTATEFLVTESDAMKHSLATDGTTLAWVEEFASQEVGAQTPGTLSLIKIYDVASGTISTLITTVNAEFAWLALDGGVLYYLDTTPTHKGLFARKLLDNLEVLIRDAAVSNVTADNGTVLWSEQTYVSDAPEVTYSITDTDSITVTDPITAADRFFSPSAVTTTLHLSTLDGTISNMIVAGAQGCLTGFSISGDNVVYAFGCGVIDERVYLYNIGTANLVALSSGPASYPLINSTAVIWTTPPTGVPGEANEWSVQEYDLDITLLKGRVGTSSAYVRAEVFVTEGLIALKVVDDATADGYSLYLNARIVDLNGVVPAYSNDTPTLDVATACDRTRPATCGRVRKSGRFFYDDGGYWPMNGVQFILPQSGGLKGETFTTAVYVGAVNDGSLEYWLGIAQNYLLAKTLRVFVPLPTENTNTCLPCLVDFATRANNHGMRLGVVLRNSTAQMDRQPGDTLNRNWLASFYSTFSNSNGGSSKIAYVNIDNEANNHASSNCRMDRPQDKDAQGRVIDCYDRYALTPYNRTYIDKVATWARDFNTVYAAQGSTILRTVGLATEMGNADNIPPENDFFRYPTPGLGLLRLVDYVDFLSPHNYGQGAANSLLGVRSRFTGPIMLEEFGWPTDPLPKDPAYRDGHQSLCRIEPMNNAAACATTAPYYLEVNARAVRDMGTNGYAGSAAWMLADINSMSCSAAKDYFTGLFTANTTYCGGTTHPHLAYAKNTAYRLRTHHYYFNPHP